MAQMLIQTIEQIGREKNIEPGIIVEAIEEAMAVAAQKFYRTEDNLEASLNPETGELELHAVKTVVEEVEDPHFEITVDEAVELGMEDPQVGDVWRSSMPTDQLGRIAAQAAKQVIYQKVRDAERDNIYAEFSERVGELLTGIVKRFERGDMIIDLGRTEAILPRREQSRAEHYNIGDRVRVVIIEVLRATRGPQVVVSRNSPDLLRRLFEMEVPEIYDQTVVIKEAVREGGDRAKVAVHSVEADVDPVGACVGMRGSRVQAIIRELRGEKIDIVEWSSDSNQFAINSLKPARVNRVKEITKINEEGEPEPHLEVIVDEDQLSLAIGKRGQNVRLAGKLLGRKIDVMSEEQRREQQAAAEAAAAAPEPAVEETEATAPASDEAETAAASGDAPAPDSGGTTDIETLPGVGPKAAAALVEAGFADVDAVAAAEVESIMAVPGIGAVTAKKIVDAARAATGGVAEAAGAEDSEQVAAENVADGDGTDAETDGGS